MRLLKPILLALLMAFPALAQIVPPQIVLSGNIGCASFPCQNTGTIILGADANHTMTALETSATSFKVTSSVSLTGTRDMVFPAGRFPLNCVENSTTGGQIIRIIGPSGGAVSVPNGQAVCGIWNDGTNFVTGTTSGGSGTVSGQASSVIPLGTSATVIGNQSHLSDNGTTVTSTEPIAVNSSGASQEAFTYNSTPITAGSGTTAVVGADASGNLVAIEAAGSISHVCTAANLACAGSALPSQSVTFNTSAGTFTAACQSGYTCTSLGGVVIINGTWLTSDGASVNWSTSVPTASQFCKADQTYLAAATDYNISSQPVGTTQFQFNFHVAAGSTSTMYIAYQCTPK